MNEVLLAEDEPVSRRYLSEALQSLGYRCVAVADGTAALELARARRFDLLIMDVNLPELSGQEVLERLRQDKAAASHRTVAVALTADNSPGLQQRLRDVGFVEVGTKPIALGPLDALLHAAWRHAPPPEPPEPKVVWDDETALRASGSQGNIASLRELMLKELPAQRTTIVTAIDEGDLAAARNELHRLSAACGFCGATALANATDDLHRMLNEGIGETDTLSNFLKAVDATLHKA